MEGDFFCHSNGVAIKGGHVRMHRFVGFLCFLLGVAKNASHTRQNNLNADRPGPDQPAGFFALAWLACVNSERE